MVISVTGASGGVGGRVAHRLASAGADLRLIVRDPERAPAIPGVQVAQAAYGDTAALRRACAGTDTLFFVSAHEDEDRVGLHRGVVDAATRAGVRRVVYLSFVSAAPDATFTFARDHFHTEEHIRASGLRATFLRDNLYTDYIPSMAGADGVIRGPGGTGTAAVVTRDDIADVAVAVLLSDRHDGQTYDITGPESLSFADMAAQLSEVVGREITYVPETLAEARSSRAHYGAAEWEVEGWITSYAAVANGDLHVVTDTVLHLTGHPPQSLSDFLRANPDSYRHLLGG